MLFQNFKKTNNKKTYFLFPIHATFKIRFLLLICAFSLVKKHSIFYVKKLFLN